MLKFNMVVLVSVMLDSDCMPAAFIVHAELTVQFIQKLKSMNIFGNQDRITHFNVFDESFTNSISRWSVGT